MKKILFIVETLNCGGIETLLISIQKNIDTSIYQIDYLLATNEPCFYTTTAKQLGANIFYVPSRNKGIRQHKKMLNEFFKKHSYDIVHYNCSSLSNVNYLKFAKKNNVKERIVHVHSVLEPNHFMHKVLHIINKKRISNLATYFLSCSKDASYWCYPKSIINSKKHKIIKNGIEVNKFRYDEIIRNEIRNNLNVKNNDILLGNVGRLIKSKNQIFCIEILNKLLENNPNYKLILVGEGENKNNLIELCRSKEISSNVIFYPATQDVFKLYQAMDIFVFPSLYEGLGMTVIEAQYSGLPCMIYETLPNELNISPNIFRFSLDSMPDTWCEKIIEIPSFIDRKNIKLNSEYDIKEVIKELMNIYRGSEND